MKGVVIFVLCIVTGQCWPGPKPTRPNFDCDHHCGNRGFSEVCSTEGKTFKNKCYLKCNWHYEACDGPCPCNRAPAPEVVYVQGPSKVVYAVEVQRNCGCSLKYDPVCGNDEETYDNECLADCAGAGKWYDGRCYG